MSTEISNRFNSKIATSVTGLNPSGTFTVPVGCYFRGQYTVFGTVESTIWSVGLRDASSNYACMLSPVINPGVSGKGGATIALELDEGTWTIVANQQNSGSAIIVSITGICYNK